jgi:hypothetical protein
MALQSAVQQPSQLRHAFHPGGGTQARVTLKGTGNLRCISRRISGYLLHDFNRNLADSRALAYPILCELYDPGKQAKTFVSGRHPKRSKENFWVLARYRAKLLEVAGECPLRVRNRHSEDKHHCPLYP